MARTQIHPVTLAVDGFVADPADGAVSTGAGNGVYVVPAEADMENVVLRVHNAGGSAANVSAVAGAWPLADASGQGPLTVTVAAGATEWVGPFTSARFAQADGSLAVDTDAAVSVTAFRVNRH